MTFERGAHGVRSRDRETPAAIGVWAALCCALLLAPGIPAAADTAPSATVPAVAGTDPVQAIEAHYPGLADLIAKVVQKNFLKSVEKTQVFDGTLAIKRPGKLRLDYTNGQIIVVDGSDAWFYSKKSSQAIRATIRNTGHGRIGVAFDHPVAGATPGQAAVFYDGDTVVGGGIIQG